MITITMPPQQMARVLRRYCYEQGLAESRFGREALNDPCLLSDLSGGRRTLRPATVERVIAYVEGR